MGLRLRLASTLDWIGTELVRIGLRMDQGWIGLRIDWDGEWILLRLNVLRDRRQRAN